MLKTLLASASLSLVLLFLPALGPVSATGVAGLSSAHAIDVGIDIGGDDDDDGITIGIGDDDDDDDDDDADNDDDDDNEKAISCRAGKRVVERAGYTKVKTRECTGKNYHYLDRRKGKNYEIVVSRFGRILSTKRR